VLTNKKSCGNLLQLFLLTIGQLFYAYEIGINL